MTWLGNSRQRIFFPIFTKHFPSFITYLVKILRASHHAFRDVGLKLSFLDDEDMSIVYKPMKQNIDFVVFDPFSLFFEVPTVILSETQELVCFLS